MASVLLAEPSVPVAGALRRYLEGARHEVYTVGSVDEALRAARVRPPALVLASGTGTLDGEALCRGLRAQGLSVPVLLVYPPQEESADERATEAGADGCLVGPLKRANVLTCVALLLQREEARRLAAPESASGVVPGAASTGSPGPGATLHHGVGSTSSPGPGGMQDAGSGADLDAEFDRFSSAVQAAAPGAPAASGGAPGMARGASPAFIAARTLGFAITPVPRSLTTLELEGRRITRSETPAVGASPDFEFLKRLMLMEVKRSRRYRYSIALLLVELDRFAERSAALTPAARTVVLVEALGLLVTGVRDIDVAVPFADSRFVVFLPHTPRSGALVVGERLRKRAGSLRGLPGASASVGVAVSEPPGGKASASGVGAQVSFGSLMKEAGEALRRAQAAGGDRVEWAGGKPQPG